VKAIQDGRWGKVHALQHLLTYSFSAKALAVRRVTENQGKRTPGVDRDTWKTPEQKATAIGTLRQRGYRPQPLRRVYIAKSNGKCRDLGIPTMRDRAMQALYLLGLDPIAETLANPHSYGFRTHRAQARCHRAVLHGAGQEGLAPVGVEAQYPRVLRRNQPQLALGPHPDG
jgi:RNA-directed DNA polymerase